METDTMGNTTANLLTVRGLATEGANIHADLRAAREAADTAEAQVLAAMLAAVSPALRALSARPIVGERHLSLATDRQRSYTTRAKWRGLLVSGSAEPTRDTPRADSGEYKGDGLYLREDGAFVEVRYSGSWSRWQGSSLEWATEVHEAPLNEVAHKYDAEEIIATVVAALRAYTEGRAGKRARDLRAKADRLAAAAALIAG